MEEYPLRWINDYLAVGYAPRSTDQLQWIHNAGISAIVNLCAECYDLHEAEKASNFEVLYLAVTDEEAPTLAQIQATVEWIDLQKDLGKKTLVHCRYGVGRTGTVVLAHLLHCGISFNEAEKMMEHTPSWPATNVQKRCIDNYTKTLQAGSIQAHFEEKCSGSIGRFFRRLEVVLKWDD